MPKLPPAPPSCNLPDDLIYSIVNVSPAVAPANNLSAPSGAPSDRAPPSDFFHNITNHPMSSLASGTSCVSLPIYKLSRAILHPTEPPKLNKLTSDMGSMGPESTPNTLFLALSQPNHPFAAYLTDELPRLASKPLITSSAVTDKLEDIKCARCRHYAVSVWHKTMNAKTGLLSLDIDSHGNDSSLFDVESGHQTNVAYTIGGDRNSLDNCKHPIYVSNITLPAILSLPPYILSLSGIPATYRPESSHKSTLSDCVPVGVGSSSTAVRRSTMSWPTIPDAPTLPLPRPTSKDNFYLNLHFASLRKHNKALNDAASIVTGLYIDRILYGDLGGEEVVFQGMLKGSTVSAASYKGWWNPIYNIRNRMVQGIAKVARDCNVETVAETEEGLVKFGEFLKCKAEVIKEAQSAYGDTDLPPTTSPWARDSTSPMNHLVHVAETWKRFLEACENFNSIEHTLLDAGEGAESRREAMEEARLTKLTLRVIVDKRGKEVLMGVGRVCGTLIEITAMTTGNWEAKGGGVLLQKLGDIAIEALQKIAESVKALDLSKMEDREPETKVLELFMKVNFVARIVHKLIEKQEIAETVMCGSGARTDGARRRVDGILACCLWDMTKKLFDDWNADQRMKEVLKQEEAEDEGMEKGTKKKKKKKKKGKGEDKGEEVEEEAKEVVVQEKVVKEAVKEVEKEAEKEELVQEQSIDELVEAVLAIFPCAREAAETALACSSNVVSAAVLLLTDNSEAEWGVQEGKKKKGKKEKARLGVKQGLDIVSKVEKKEKALSPKHEKREGVAKVQEVKDVKEVKEAKDVKDVKERKTAKQSTLGPESPAFPGADFDEWCECVMMKRVSLALWRKKGASWALIE